ncbi:MAG: hypothetical protein GX028_01705, partial [Clostridiaceae bacterium]|nr:hypothetical protein [Clostridiaceae bacterium]
LRMSHRVCVMCEGRLTGIISSAEATQESIMHYATMREVPIVDESKAIHDQGEIK